MALSGSTRGTDSSAAWARRYPAPRFKLSPRVRPQLLLRRELTPNVLEHPRAGAHCRPGPAQRRHGQAFVGGELLYVQVGRNLAMVELQTIITRQNRVQLRRP
jgi:hypothetical protein